MSQSIQQEARHNFRRLFRCKFLYCSLLLCNHILNWLMLWLTNPYHMVNVTKKSMHCITLLRKRVCTCVFANKHETKNSFIRVTTTSVIIKMLPFLWCKLASSVDSMNVTIVIFVSGNAKDNPKSCDIISQIFSTNTYISVV
jgi:hypothetical protein